jgi:hypothetical protein
MLKINIYHNTTIKPKFKFFCFVDSIVDHI